jgi:hypothetical protein
MANLHYIRNIIIAGIIGATALCLPFNCNRNAQKSEPILIETLPKSNLVNKINNDNAAVKLDFISSVANDNDWISMGYLRVGGRVGYTYKHISEIK